MGKLLPESLGFKFKGIGESLEKLMKNADSRPPAVIILIHRLDMGSRICFLNGHLRCF